LDTTGRPGMQGGSAGTPAGNGPGFANRPLARRSRSEIMPGFAPADVSEGKYGSSTCGKIGARDPGPHRLVIRPGGTILALVSNPNWCSCLKWVTVTPRESGGVEPAPGTPALTGGLRGQPLQSMGPWISTFAGITNKPCKIKFR